MDPFFGIDLLFNAMNMNTPSCNTSEQNTPTSRRAWSRQRPQDAHYPFDLFAHPGPNFADIMRQQYHDQEPYGMSRIEELDDYDEAGRPYSAGYAQPRAHRPDLQRPPVRVLRSHGISFAQAAREMHAALVCANQECRSVESSFETQTRQLLTWLPAPYLKSLWTIRLNWSGRSENSSTITGSIESAARSSPDVITYDGVIQRFNTALAAIKSCAPPDRTSARESRLPLGWEVLGSTMRKLQISLEAIEELLVLIKTQRDRMPLLLHEISSAQHFLESVREVWETSKTAGKKSDTANPSASASARSDHGWPGFSPPSMGGERFDDFGIEI